MEERICEICGSNLLKKGPYKYKCIDCSDQDYIESRSSSEFLETTFNKEWVRQLYLGYVRKIHKYYSINHVRKSTTQAIKCFKIFDSELESQQQLNKEVYTRIINSDNRFKKIKSSLWKFLLDSNIVREDTEKEKINKIKAYINDVFEDEFYKGVEKYVSAKLAERQRQVNLNYRNPTKLITIESHIYIFRDFYIWLRQCYKNINNWGLVSESIANNFLLKCKPNSRIQVSKTLMNFYKFMKDKKIVFQVPFVYIKFREPEMKEIILDLGVQREIAKQLTEKYVECPFGALVANFAFFHGLSTSEMLNLKLSDIDIDENKILTGKRMLILDALDMLILKNYLLYRKEANKAEYKSYLFVRNDNGTDFRDTSVSKSLIRIKCYDFIGHNPSTLRFTFFFNIGSIYGPELLIQAYGLSKAMSERYANFGTEFIDLRLLDSLEKMRLNLEYLNQ